MIHKGQFHFQEPHKNPFIWNVDNMREGIISHHNGRGHDTQKVR